MRVLIVRLGSMGDVLHALPAVAALRETHPDAHIGWAIERRWIPFLVSEGASFSGPRNMQRPLVDYVHVVNTLGWRKAPFSGATWSSARNTFRDLRDERYDLAIDFQGSIKSALVAQLSGAPSPIGFAQPREKPATMLYTRLVQPSGRHIIDQNLSLMTSAIPLCSSVSSVVNVLPIDPAAESATDELWDQLPTAGPTKRIAILNPGAGWPAKQWPASRYGEVARALRHDGIFCLVNHGPGEEGLAREVEAASDGAARPILCSLPELIALTRRAALFIGGDTGPMHLSALLDIPTVALFGPTDPARNGPYSPNAIVLRHLSSRSTTSHSSAPDPGLSKISAQDVVSAAGYLLRSGSRLPKPDAPPEPTR